MKTILVTGANGFIGSHTLSFLEKQTDIRLIAACRNKSKLPSDFTGEVRLGDLRDENYLANLLDDVDVLVNGMAWSSLWGNKQRSDELFYQPSVKLIEQYYNSNASSLINISSTAAASPDRSTDPMSKGIPRKFWPHMVNVIKLENKLRENASLNKKIINMRLGIFYW